MSPTLSPKTFRSFDIIIMSDFKLSSVLQRPINEEHWPHLENIIKALKEFIVQKARNREYIEAQRAKEKIIEAQDEIRKRKRFQIQQRQRLSIEELVKKNEEERLKLQKEWDVRRKKIENQYAEQINKKIDKYNLERDKYLQQIEIALPLNNSPDKELFHLKHQEDQAVSCGDFIEAQRIKTEITKREIDLSNKYQKLRESNIKAMMAEFESKHSNQILILESRRDEKINENEKIRLKKLKELMDRHERQMKQLIWVYNEEKKKCK